MSSEEPILRRWPTALAISYTPMYEVKASSEKMFSRIAESSSPTTMGAKWPRLDTSSHAAAASMAQMMYSLQILNGVSPCPST